MLLRETQARILDAATKAGLPPVEQFQVEITPKPELGDLATNYAMVAAKSAKANPRALAEQLAAALRTLPEFSAVEIAGPGFVNLRLAPNFIDASLARLAKEPLDGPTRGIHAGETVLLEVGSENVAKPMGVGHLRSNIIGMACARMWRLLGAKTVVVNHLGDWGTQFGKLAVAVKKWGNDKAIEERGIAELVELYQRFTLEAKNNPELEDEARAAFHDLEQGEPGIRALWERFVALSLREYQAMYERLGVKHDHILGESFYEKMMEPIMQELLDRGIAIANPDGSIGIEFPNKELPSTILRKKNGSTLYLTRDMATLKYRSERFKTNQSFYFVGAEQALHFQQVFLTAKLLGWTYPAVHAPHGLLLGSGGKKMSTREGTAVTIAELFSRAEETARAILTERESELQGAEREQLAQRLATAAIMYNDLSQNRTTAIVFDWEKMLSFEGDTAPYLLYAVARTHALDEKARAAGIEAGEISVSHPLERVLGLALLQFHDRVILAAETLKPNLLAEQLFRIAQNFNSFYAELPIVNAEDPRTSASRLALVHLTRALLRGGLDLLGIPRVERM